MAKRISPGTLISAQTSKAKRSVAQNFLYREGILDKLDLTVIKTLKGPTHNFLIVGPLAPSNSLPPPRKWLEQEPPTKVILVVGG